MIKIFSLVLLQLLWMSCFSQINKTAIDSVFVEWDDSNSPGCAMGIFIDGEIAYSRGYGSANLEYSIPNSTTSVFRIGSTSKQFTAACIVLLEQQGKLKFDEKLAEFFPEFPSYAENISVRHLLNHTSGLRDYLSLAYLKGLDDDDFYTDEDIMRWLIKQEDLNFQTGTEYVYCNSGYWLLSQIVKEVTGLSMAEYAHQEIFEPLGMNNTHFHDDHTEIVPNRASGYQPTEDGYAISMTTLDMIGDGGIFTTIEDIRIWDDAFYSSAILDSKFWEEMTRQGILNDNTTIDYASGLMIGEYRGLSTIRHGGAFVGFRAELLRFPHKNLSIAIFANRSDANPSRMANQVADIVLKGSFEDGITSKEANVAEEVSIIDKKHFEGDYEIQPGVIFTVSIVNDSIHIFQSWNESEYNLAYLGGNTFHIPNSNNVSFNFKNLEEGFTQIIDVNQSGSITECKRKKPFDITSVHNENFVGSYYSNELEVNYLITEKKGDLFLSVNQLEPEKLTPNDTDQFYGAGSLTFVREKNVVVGFILDAGRVKNLKFKKN